MIFSLALGEDFKGYITEVNHFKEKFRKGGQLIFQFPNGYGASLVNHSGSYGNEIAVLKNNEICYNNDVIGKEGIAVYLEKHEIIQVLKQIKEL